MGDLRFFDGKEGRRLSFLTVWCTEMAQLGARLVPGTCKKKKKWVVCAGRMERSMNLCHLAVRWACFAALPQSEQFENKQ